MLTENIMKFTLVQKECPRCSKMFFPKNTRTVYCHSDECKKILNRQEYEKHSPAYRRPNSLPIKNCVVCDREFRPRKISNAGVCGNPECRYQRKLQKNKKHKQKQGKFVGNYNDKSRVKSYGLTLESFAQMRKYQNYCCKICGLHESKNQVDKNGKTKQFSIDHDHKTGQIRGLLCNNCNLALGGFKDSISSLKKAIMYLKGSKKSKVYMPKDSYIIKKSA
jgi:hypothetical protein